MDAEELLQRAIDIARRAHEGQVDKAGAPYIEHPLRVMRALEAPEAKIAGVLHDVVEDTPVTLEDLREARFSAAVISAVDALTKRDGEGYEAYLERLTKDPVAVRVKIADMSDNMDLSRISEPTEKDRRRLEKYRRVLPRLQAVLRAFEA